MDRSRFHQADANLEGAAIGFERHNQGRKLGGGDTHVLAGDEGGRRDVAADSFLFEKGAGVSGDHVAEFGDCASRHVIERLQVKTAHHLGGDPHGGLHAHGIGHLALDLSDDTEDHGDFVPRDHGIPQSQLPTPGGNLCDLLQNACCGFNEWVDLIDVQGSTLVCHSDALWTGVCTDDISYKPIERPVPAPPPRQRSGHWCGGRRQWHRSDANRHPPGRWMFQRRSAHKMSIPGVD